MLDYDSRLHIDPALLSNCAIPEFRGAMKKVTEYFDNVLKLATLASRGDKLWQAALKLLTFGEGLQSGLGYSTEGTRGSGIGPRMAATILENIKQIVDAGIHDSKIFELVPVIEDKIGADRISDMISIILKTEFVNYTLRVAS